MYQTINFSQFHDAFRQAGRYGQFSYGALDALFSAFEEMEGATGVPIELDVIAICCDYAESHYISIADNYSIEMPETEDEDAKKAAVRDFLEHHTMFISESEEGVFVYQQF